MSNETIYTQLYDNMEFYRPPREEHSAFLEIAYGCSWAGCTFCDFIKDEYKVYSLKDVARKAQLLSQVMEGRTRIHFLGCNPLALPQDYLLDVFMLTRRYIPQATEYSMYARLPGESQGWGSLVGCHFMGSHRVDTTEVT